MKWYFNWKSNDVGLKKNVCDVITNLYVFGFSYFDPNPQSLVSECFLYNSL